MVLRKFDGSLHWHFSMDHLGDDEHGVWLGGPPGTVLQRGAEPPIVQQHAFALLVPASGSWIASWNTGGPYAVYVDVTTRPEWQNGTLQAGAGVVVFAPFFHRDDTRLDEAHAFGIMGPQGRGLGAGEEALRDVE